MSTAPGLPPNTFIMKGGFREQMGDLFHKYEQPVMVLTGVFMTLVIVFVGQIPIEIRKQADTVIGRAALILFTLIVVMVFGWPLGIVAGLMSAILIGAGGVHPVQQEVKEGFSSEMNVRLVPSRQKWFVEQVLGENPLIIEDDTVETSAVQDLSEKSTGFVQSNSVTR